MTPPDMRNIAILAHVDAGKTTVSERLLYFSQSISGLGEVDEGLATMDYLEEEKKRGITIEAGIASYTWKQTTVTFVDTPGHVDFGVEVDFALQAVEGVVLVISGISGIESQSLEAWEKIIARKNARLVYINKLDLSGADHRKVMKQIQVTFEVKPFALTLPIYVDGKIDGVVDVINQLALYRSVQNPRKLIKGDVPEKNREEYLQARHELVDIAAEFDDEVLEAFVKGEEPTHDQLMRGIRYAMESGMYLPVYMGSALCNVGIRQLMNGIKFILPAPDIKPEEASRQGFVIKIRYYQGIGKIFLIKLFHNARKGDFDGSRLYRVFAENLSEIEAAEAGEIVALQTERSYRMGQFLQADGDSDSLGLKVYKPLLQSRIELNEEKEYDFVRETLARVSEAEPSILIESDPETGGWIINTVGELQLEVFTRRLMKEFGCNIRVGAPRVKYNERLKIRQEELENSASAMGSEIRIKLTVSPHEEDRNLLTLESELDIEPQATILRGAFEQFTHMGPCGYGPIAHLHCHIKELGSGHTPSGEIPPPLIAKCLLDCLALGLGCSKFDIFEPIMRLEIIVPDEYCGAVLSDLASRSGVVRKLDSDGYNSIILLEIPLEKTFGYTTLLRSLSKGLGVYVLTYEKHGLKAKSAG